MSSDDLDRINKRAWRAPGTLRLYRKLAGWTDPGEEAAFTHAMREAAGQPILDIGVGGGRTTPIWRAVSSDYTGIDYTPEIAAICRQKSPGATILEMDARDLSAFADASFFLVVFTFNGIDAVDYPGRLRILREVHRVLRPGGIFIVSGHNRDGPGHDEGLRLDLPWTPNPVRLLWRGAKALRSLLVSLCNRRRNRRYNTRHPDYSIMNAAAHDFGIVVLYATFAEQARQLSEAGFQVEAAYDNREGKLVTRGDDTSRFHWFHFVARKPA